MKTCEYCGVELENNMNFCPLCGEPVMDKNADQPEDLKVLKREQEETLITDYQKLSESQKRKLFWEISGIVLISAIFVPFIIDFIGHNTIAWSKYTISVCAVLFANTTFISFWYKRTYLLLLGSFVSTSFLLVLFSMFNGSVGLELKLGIPLLLAAYIVILLSIIMLKLASKKGLNIIAFLFIAVGLLGLCAEGIISLYTHNKIHFGWSVIVMASVLPVTALLLFLYYRLKKGTDLRRFFHI